MAEGSFRVALMGAGRIAGAVAMPGDPALTHAAAIAAVPGLTLTAIVEPDAGRRAAFAARWNVPDQAASIAGLAQRPDIVAIAVPDRLHVQALDDVLAHFAPALVLMEKPLCLDQNELAGMARLLEAHPQTRFAVNNTRRFDAGHAAVRDLLLCEKLGPLVDLRWVYYGGWLHNGVHMIDTMRMLLDDTLDLAWVRAGYPGAPGDPCLDAEFRPRKRPHVRVMVESFPESAFQLFEAEIRCQDGRVRLMDFGDEILVDRVLTNARGERELKHTRRLALEAAARPMLVFYRAAAALLRDGDQGLLEKSGFATAAETMRILFEARKSL